MSNLRILLASGEEVAENDIGIEEIDDVKDRIVRGGGGKPHWAIFGDTIVYTQAISAIQLT